MRRFCWAFTLTLGVMTGTVSTAIAQSSVASTTCSDYRKTTDPAKQAQFSAYLQAYSDAAVAPIPAMSKAPLPWPKMPGRSATGAARMVRAPTAKPWLRSWARQPAVQVHRRPHLPLRLPRRNQPLARWARPRAAQVVPSLAPAERRRNAAMRPPTPGLRTIRAIRNAPSTPGVSVSSRRRRNRLLLRMVCIGGHGLGSPSDRRPHPQAVCLWEKVCDVVTS